jgi:RND superfamily putative drug exporter
VFSRWGAFVYRRRRVVLLLAVLLGAGMSILATRTSGELIAGGWLDPNSESAQVSDRLRNEFGLGNSNLIALFRTTTSASATSAEFQAAIAEAVAPLVADPRVTGVTGYAETADARFISTAGDAAYVLIGLDMTDDASVKVAAELMAKADPPAGYSVAFTGYGPLQRDASAQEERDLQKAEAVSLPIAAIVLVTVFASLIAAAIPLLVAGLAIPTALGFEYLVASRTDMSIYVLSVSTMLGLALAIDYSLFIVSRFREELAAGRTVEAAVTRAVGTAGKAVAFSGLAVAIGQSGLLWFRAVAISSIGVAGAIVVGCSLLYALTFLPALLGVLGPRVNSLSVRGLRRRVSGRGSAADEPAVRGSRWERVARAVMRRPFAVLVPTLAFLFLVGSPFLRLEQGVPGADVYPAGVPSRDTYVALQNEFAVGQSSPLTILADVSGGPTDEATVAAVLALGDRIAALDGVDAVEGPFALRDPATGEPLSAARVAQVYAAPAGSLPAAVEAAISRLRDTYIRDGVVQLTATSPERSTSPAGTAVAHAIRGVALPAGIERIQVGGVAALAADFLDSQADRIPWALATTLVASAIVLFLLFGSIAIPIKAVLMTLLSLSASFGALVWIFQDGNLRDLLDFQLLGYTIAGNPIIMFATLIGLSMDYEVLLLSRVQEAYRRTRDNSASVAEGLARTASVITGAALIMVSVFAAFALAQTLTVKALGVGLAIAVLLDATIVRVLLVPATMRLLGDWNWWAPGPLGRLAERLGFSHVEAEVEGG